MRLAGRRVTSFATIKPVPLTSENSKRVRATPVEDTAMGATFCLKSYFFDQHERVSPKGGGSPLIASDLTLPA